MAYLSGSFLAVKVLLCAFDFFNNCQRGIKNCHVTFMLFEVRYKRTLKRGHWNPVPHNDADKSSNSDVAFYPLVHQQVIVQEQLNEGRLMINLNLSAKYSPNSG